MPEPKANNQPPRVRQRRGCGQPSSTSISCAHLQAQALLLGVTGLESPAALSLQVHKRGGFQYARIRKGLVATARVAQIGQATWKILMHPAYLCIILRNANQPQRKGSPTFGKRRRQQAAAAAAAGCGSGKRRRGHSCYGSLEHARVQ